MQNDDPRSLPQERLQAIWTALIEAGQVQAAKELSEHIACMDDKLTTMQQYYEEYLIPGIEGRSVGAWSDRVVMVPRDSRSYIQEKSGKKVSLD